MKKLSIITAVHNQIEYNRLFLESLEKNTYHPYDLIIIDNASHDGSGPLFADHGATVLKNETNTCYACSQNQGLEVANTTYVAFLNNDICLSKHWDKKLIEYLEVFGLDAISPSGIEMMEDADATRKAMRRWRRINAVQRLRVASGIRYSARSLASLVRRMYGDWESFTDKRSRRFEGFLYPGISGNCILTKRSVFDKIGPWNTQVAASDWDLQLRLVKRQSEKGDMKQCMIACNVFVHHFIRATFRSVKVPCSCGHAPREIADVYPGKDLCYLNRPKLSLIIAVHNKPEFLEKVFASLLNQTLLDFEIVVADDGSGPQIADLVSQWNGKFLYPIAHVWQKHEGFRKTVIANTAVVRSRSDYLCFIDGDCIVHHRFLEDHLKTRRAGTVLSGRRIMLDEELTATLTLRDVQSRRIEKPSFWLGHVRLSNLKHGLRLPAVSAIEDAWRSKKNYCILGSNFSVYKGDYYRVNGYEEAITGRGLEDNNLSNRFKRAGIRIRTVARKAIQYHLFHSFDPVPHSREVIARWGTPGESRAEKGIVKSA
jgi:glycosyltransferase involved in cell wall biosynthesis